MTFLHCYYLDAKTYLQITSFHRKVTLRGTLHLIKLRILDPSTTYAIEESLSVKTYPGVPCQVPTHAYF